MTNDEPDMLVRRFVDGDLSDVEVQQALHRIADDPEARDLLQFELHMMQDLAATRSAQPPSDFADRTMEAVVQESVQGGEHASIASSLRSAWNVLTGSVTLRVQPASVAVAALLVAVVAWTIWPAGPVSEKTGSQVASETPTETQRTVQQTAASTTEGDRTVWIRFLYTNSEADSVAVAGDFSEWEPVPLSPRTVNGETVWTGLVPVPRGEHEYQFLIDGKQWVTDPLAPVKRSDGFGAKNAVLNV
jgi:hypothetical protein